MEGITSPLGSFFLISLLPICIYYCSPSISKHQLCQPLGSAFHVGVYCLRKDNAQLGKQEKALTKLVKHWGSSYHMVPVPESLGTLLPHHKHMAVVGCRQMAHRVWLSCSVLLCLAVLVNPSAIQVQTLPSLTVVQRILFVLHRRHKSPLTFQSTAKGLICCTVFDSFSGTNSSSLLFVRANGLHHEREQVQ